MIYILLITITYLLICTYTDITTLKINFLISALFSAIGVVLFMLSLTEHSSLSDLLASLFIGMMTISLSILTHGSIGIGDGIMILTLGCFYTFTETISIVMYSFLASALFSIIFLLFRKCSGKDRIPFAPFLLSGCIFH